MLISRKKLIKETVNMYIEYADHKTPGADEFYYACGNANALSGICGRLGINLNKYVLEEKNRRKEWGESSAT